MPSKVGDLRRPCYAALSLAGLLALTAGFLSFFSLPGMPAKIEGLKRESARLQEKLIRAQITAQSLHHVQDLIEKNLAYSSRDSLAQGASLSFLKDLTQVLDQLKISLVSLDPQRVVDRKTHLETPYKMEIVCSYRQLNELVNKMEKSPRLISLKEFEIENFVNDYFDPRKGGGDHCRVTLQLTTLTLLKGKS